MGFRTGSYASVFSVRKGNGNYYDVRIATSKKDSRTGTYTTDFSGFVRFAGQASTIIGKYFGMDSKANGNRPITRIKLGEVDTTNNYDSKKGVTYTNHVVFTCEEVDNVNTQNRNSNTTPNPTTTTTMSATDYVNSLPSGDEESLFT